MQSFIAKSPASLKVYNVVKAAARLPVNIMVLGEIGTGKETLIRSIFDQIPHYSVSTLPQKIESDTIFVRDFEKVQDVIAFMRRYEGVRIIAAATDERSIYEEYFPVLVTIPPLCQRPEDVEALKRAYIHKACEEFEIEGLDENFSVDLSKNAISLKRSVYERVLFATMDEEKMMRMLEEFLEPRVEEGYKELLRIFEIPLLRAAKKRFRSALAMSKALGLNRATLTTKLKRHGFKV